MGRFAPDYIGLLSSDYNHIDKQKTTAAFAARKNPCPTVAVTAQYPLILNAALWPRHNSTLRLPH